MKKKRIFHLVIIGLISWIVPFAVSMFMVNPETGDYLPNIVVFSITMIVVFLLTVLVCLLLYRRKQPRFSLFRVGNTILLVCVILDLLVLVLLFKMPFVEWASRVLPTYLVGIYGIAGLLRATSKNKATS